MTIKEQLRKLKDNWLIAALVLVLVLFSLGGNMLSITSQLTSPSFASKGMAGVAQERSIAYDSYNYGYYPPAVDSDFAPDVKDRKISKSASMNSEVERGTFDQAESKLKSIISSTDSFLLNENVNNYGTGLEQYKYGSYSIKIESEKYEAVIAQLKSLGKIKSFNENVADITGRYTSIEDEIRFEKDKLKRYQDMLLQAAITEDKINLIDRIANQERTIKYLEDSLEKQDLKVSYSTVSLSITEKQSGYANIGLVNVSDLVRNFVESLNGLFSLVFVLIPWAIAAFVIRIFWKVLKKKQGKK